MIETALYRKIKNGLKFVFSSHLSEYCWCVVLCEWPENTQNKYRLVFLFLWSLFPRSTYCIYKANNFCCTCATNYTQYANLCKCFLLIFPWQLLCPCSRSCATGLMLLPVTCCSLFIARPSEKQWLCCFLFAAVFVRVTVLACFFFQNDGGRWLLHRQHSQLST